jgi:hypothetical protein
MENNLIVLDQRLAAQSRRADLICRLEQFDKSLSDDECLAAVAILNIDGKTADLDQAAAAARSIMNFFPRSDVADPNAYALGMAAIMSEYPQEVIARITDPRTGIVRRLKFLPRLAEIAEACDEEIKRRKTLRAKAICVMWYRDRKSENDHDSYSRQQKRLDAYLSASAA